MGTDFEEGPNVIVKAYVRRQNEERPGHHYINRLRQRRSEEIGSREHGIGHAFIATAVFVEAVAAQAVYTALDRLAGSHRELAAMPAETQSLGALAVNTQLELVDTPIQQQAA